MFPSETYYWHVLAERLGMSVARCQREVSAAEFVDWLAHDDIKAMFRAQAEAEARMKANMR